MFVTLLLNYFLTKNKMPFKRRRKFRKKRRKRTYKVSTSKLLDKKINTLYEKRAKAIAEKVVAANIVHLIDRSRFWGNVDLVTNEWQTTRPIYYDASSDDQVRQLCRIDKSDINFVTNVPDSNSGDDDNDPEMDQDGAQQGMLTQTMHGRRNTDLILIDGITIAIKLFCRRGTPSVYPAMDFNDVRFKWAVVKVTDANALLNSTQQVTPEVDELLPYHSWGYSRTLDHEENQKDLFIKKKTLMKGSVRFNLSDIRYQEKTVTRFLRFKKPLKMTYAPADQNGIQTENFKVYFVARSNIPQTLVQGNHKYAEYAPRITVVSKIHYHE